MLRNATRATVVACLVLGVGSAHAGSIDALSNQSADYIRTFTRNASIDGADIVHYNPAGTSWLLDGLHFQLNTQTVFKDFVITYKGEEFGSDVPTPILPTFFTAYKTGDFAVFASFTVPAGGGTLEYEKGVPFLQPLQLTLDVPAGHAVTFEPPVDAFFEGSSLYLAPTLGVAYRFVEKFSVSVAARFIFADREFKGYGVFDVCRESSGAAVDACRETGENTVEVRGELDANKYAFGVAPIFGIHVQPIPELDIGLRYEMETDLEFETTSTLVNLKTESSGNPNALWSFADGAKEERDLPAVFAAGISGHVIPELTLNASFNYYFIKEADDRADVTGATGYAVSYDDDYDNGWDLAFSVEGRPVKGLTVSAGYNRTVIGSNKDTYSDFEYALDSHSIGLGARYFITDRFAMTLGLSGTFYQDGQNETLHPFLQAAVPSAEVEAETFSRQVFDIALGFAYRAL